jgi:hypothetical protein
MLGDFSLHQANPGIEVSVKPRMAHAHRDTENMGRIDVKRIEQAHRIHR